MVAKCTDGDTVELEDWRIRRVRYRGIDTPDEGLPEIEAKRFNGGFVGGLELSGVREPGRRVRLEFERGAKQQYDDLGRLLAYVWISRADGSDVFVNEELLRAGHAYLCGSQGSQYEDRLKSALRTARTTKAGIWASSPPSALRDYVADDDLFFHHPDYKTIDPKHPMLKKSSQHFDSRDEAIDSGRSPCHRCKP